MTGPPRDPWFRLASRTPARIGLGRSGASLPTREVLAFALAHAQARDAVHAPLDRQGLADALEELQLPTLDVDSEATDRQLYLARPDLGRRLTRVSQEQLRAVATSPCDLALMLGDGLSPRAVRAHGADLIAAFLPHVKRLGLNLGVVTLAAGARVALSDEIGAILGARAIAVLIGERPGLSAADSLGVYLTYAPRVGRTDAERNCISNIHRGGVAPAAAAANLAWLVEASLARGLTGVALKDESGTALADASVVPGLMGPDAAGPKGQAPT